MAWLGSTHRPGFDASPKLAASLGEWKAKVKLGADGLCPSSSCRNPIAEGAAQRSQVFLSVQHHRLRKSIDVILALILRSSDFADHARLDHRLKKDVQSPATQWGRGANCTILRLLRNRHWPENFSHSDRGMIRASSHMSDGTAIPEAILEVLDPDGSRHSVSISPSPFLIGRGAEAGNHLQLTDGRISRNCAALVCRDAEFYLEDRGSRHGLFVNNERMQPAPLKNGDVISFGLENSFQLVFRTEPREEAVPKLLSRLDEASVLDPRARELRHLSLLLEAGTLLQSHLPLDQVLSAMVDHAIAVTGAEQGILFEAGDDGSLRPRLARLQNKTSVAPESLSPSQTVIAQAARTRISVVESDLEAAAGDAALRQAASIVMQQLRSVVAIPLSSMSQMRVSEATIVAPKSDLLGLLYLDSRRPAAFTNLERRVLDTLALEAASVLDNARLARKELERLQLEQELAAARHIQQALLPRELHRFAHFQGTAWNVPCMAVGGDYFDVIELGPDRSAFLIADVSGKGLGAAMVTAMLQGTFSALTLGHDLAPVFNHVNRFIATRSEFRRYATLFFGILDSNGHLEYINAGHLPPLLVRGGRVEEAFEATSVPVGLFADTRYTPTSATLSPGDTLVLFTDGVNEAVNPRGERYEMERLEQVVAKHSTAGIEELKMAVLKDLERFTQGAPQADDVTLLIVRFNPTPGA